MHAAAEIKWDANKFMPLSEIKPGMKGEAYTVFSGTTVESFPFEVVTIEYNFSPQWHVIWVEASGERFENTGVAGGMSGSPGYINGRLIGALSLGYFYQREYSNLVGFTPIESMIAVTQRGMRPNISYSGGRLFDVGIHTAWKPFEPLPPVSDEFFTAKEFADTPSIPIADSRSPLLQLPVALSTMNPQALGFLKPIFDKHRLMPMQGTSGGTPVESAPIEPGQIVGIEFSRGDFTAFGYGTMTYIEGNHVIGFGHSMFGEGHVNLPLSGGYVHFILPSITRSFKVASPTKPIGTLVQDRQTAIAGLTGPHPSFMPVSANIETTDGKTHPVRYEVMRHRDISAAIAMSGVWNSISALEIDSGDHSISINTTITLQDQPNLSSQEIVRSNVYSSSFSPGFWAFQAFSPLASLIGNQYEKIVVKGVTVDIKIEDMRKTAVIEAVRINKNRYRPGEHIEAMMTLRPYLEAPIIQAGHIKVPDDAPDGLYTLLVASAVSHEAWQRTRAPLNYYPKNINQLIQLLQHNPSNNNIILEIFVPKIGMTVQGQEFPELPLSMLAVMSSPNQSGEGGYTRGTTLHTEDVPTKYVISGGQFVRFTVDRNAP